MTDIRPKTCHRRPGTGGNIRSQKIDVCSFADTNLNLPSDIYDNVDTPSPRDANDIRIDLCQESNPMLGINKDLSGMTGVVSGDKVIDEYYPTDALLKRRKHAVFELLKINFPKIMMANLFSKEFEQMYIAVKIFLNASQQERKDFIEIQNMNKISTDPNYALATDTEITTVNVFDQGLEFIVCAFLNNGYDEKNIAYNKSISNRPIATILKMAAYGFMILHKEMPGFFFSHEKEIYGDINVYSPSYITQTIDSMCSKLEDRKNVVNDMAKNSYMFLDFVASSIALLNQILYFREGYMKLISELPIISYILANAIDMMRSSYLLYFRNEELFGNDYASLIYNCGSELAKEIFKMICLLVKHTFVVAGEWNQNSVRDLFNNFIENDVISKILVFINEFLAYIPIKIDFYESDALDLDQNVGYVDENNNPIDPSTLFDSLPIFLPDELVLQIVESLALLSSSEILYDTSDKLFSFTKIFNPEIYGLEFGDGLSKRKVRNAIIGCFRNLYENVVEPTIHNQVKINTDPGKGKDGMDNLKERLCILEEIVQYLETKMM